MQSGEGGEARELISLPSRSQEQVPTTPYVVAPGEEVLSYNAYIGKLRSRVVALSVLTVGCFVVSAAVQLFFGFLSWQSLQQKLEYLAQVEAIPELSTFLNVAPQLLLTSAVPAIINALVIGGFFRVVWPLWCKGKQSVLRLLLLLLQHVLLRSHCRHAAGIRSLPELHVHKQRCGRDLVCEV